MSVVSGDRTPIKTDLFIVTNAREIKTEIFSLLSTHIRIDSEHNPDILLWFIEFIRQELLQEVSFLNKNIIIANHIYLDNDESMLNRRKHWDKAISSCFVILEHFHSCLLFFKGQVGFYEKIINDIKKEIDGLKKIKKSDRERIKKKNCNTSV